MRQRLIAVAVIAALLIGACSEAAEPDAGAVDPFIPEPAVSLYSPSVEGLSYALPSAVSGVLLVESPDELIAADEHDLATDPRIRRTLVELGLAPSVISVVQRGDSFERVPDVSVTAVQFKGLPAEDFAQFVPSVYLLATSVTTDQHNLTGAKPARRQAEIEGRAVETADWGEFDVAWYAHGDVVFIVLAKNPQLLAAALRSLPPWSEAV